LIENNIYASTSEGPIIGGSSGNVIAYNYGIDVSREDTSAAGWYMGGDWSHLLQSTNNLWEGQYAEGIMLDDIHGSSGYQTIFRSRYVGKKPGDLCMGSTCSFAYAIALGAHQDNISIVGNVLGTDGYSTKYDEATFGSGDFNIYSTGYNNHTSYDNQVVLTLLRHYNFDYVTDGVKICTNPGEPGCQGGDADSVIANSLYLSSKPSWWCNETPWPPIGPDLNPMASDIPAKRRYAGLSCTLTGGSSDTTPPSVSLTVPASGSTVSGSAVTVSANASDNVAVAGVQFRLDGVNLGAEDTISPYSISWNTTGSSNGSHTLSAIARDTSNNQTTSSGITVTVSNVVDTQAPTIPTNLSTTAVSSSQINLSWTASTDNVGVTGYRIYRCTGSGCTPSVQISTSAANAYSDINLSASTAYSYRVSAYDAVGNASGQSASASATTPAAPPVSGNIEAETGTLTSPMQRVADSLASGNAYIMTATGNSGTAVYSFNIATAGTYKIVARVYAQDGGTNSFYFKVDNLAEDAWHINSSGSPDQFNVWREEELTYWNVGAAQHQLYTVSLISGSHAITFRGREVNARLDYFRLVNVGSDTTPPAAPTGLMVQ